MAIKYKMTPALLSIVAAYLSVASIAAGEPQIPSDFIRHGGHTNNWAVLVDTSRFWFNYRHVANVLSVYR